MSLLLGPTHQRSECQGTEFLGFLLWQGREEREGNAVVGCKEFEKALFQEVPIPSACSLLDLGAQDDSQGWSSQWRLHSERG